MRKILINYRYVYTCYLYACVTYKETSKITNNVYYILYFIVERYSDLLSTDYYIVILKL